MCPTDDCLFTRPSSSHCYSEAEWQINSVIEYSLLVCAYSYYFGHHYMYMYGYVNEVCEECPSYRCNYVWMHVKISTSDIQFVCVLYSLE